MTAVVSRKLSQSNPDLSVSHIGLQRSLESLNGESGISSNKAFDGNRSFGEQLSVTNKRSRLVYMDKIAALELQLSSLVNAVSDRAAELNNKTSRDSLAVGLSQPVSTESMPKCDEVATCWSWIVQLSRLSQIHITYAAEYHKFFFEARELDAHLEQEKARVFADLSSNDRRSLGSLPFECRRLSGCMRSHLSRLMLLGQRAQELAGRSGSVQPVHHRMPGKKDGAVSRRAVALCSYTSPEGSHVVMDEELQVVDMTDRHVWRVEKSASSGGGQLDLPSVCLALLGPDPEALETMARLRETIIAVWVQILTSYKQHMGDLLRSFLEFIHMEKYTMDSDVAEASLFTFMSELESGYLCYLSGAEAAAMARLLSQIRARRSPPSDQAVRASRERRLSNVSLSSVTSTDGFGGGGGGGLSRGDSQRSSGRRTRTLKESEVIQPRALLKVLNEHVEALERLRNRRLDSNTEAGQPQLDEAALNSPAFSVPEIRIESDSSQQQSNNVYVFSNQTDTEKLTKHTQPQSPSQRRTRNPSTTSMRTVTSTVVNEEVHRLLHAGTAGSADVTDGRHSVVRSSSAVGEPSPSMEPQQHVSRMYWMVNQPTRVEREIHQAELTVRRQLAVDLPHRNFVSAKRIQIGEGCEGVRAVTRLECNYPPRRPVVDTGASLDISQESRGAQTLGDFKEVRPTSALSTQTSAPVSSECCAFLDFVSTETGVRAAEKPTPKFDQLVQTIGEFKEVRPTVALATQTPQPVASECCAFLDFASVETGVQKVEQPPPRLETSAQTVGDFKEINPSVALATQTQPPAIGECGAHKDFVSKEAGVLAEEKPPLRFETSAQTAGEFKEVLPTVALATQTQPPKISDCAAHKDFAFVETGIRAAEKTIPKSNTSAQTAGQFKEVIPTVALATQTQPPKISDCAAHKDFSFVETGIRATEKTIPKSNTSAQTAGKFKEVLPAVALATQTQPPQISECGSFQNISTVKTGVRAAEKPIPKSNTSAQTAGEFKEVLPTVALATQTQKPLASECGAFIDFASIESGVRAAEKAPQRSHSSAQTPIPEPGRGANVRVVATAPPIADCSSQLVVESLSSLAKCRPSADAVANASSQANFQLELVARLMVRNHNLEDARLLSFDRSVSDRPVDDGVASDGQARLLSSLGLACTEWSELDSKHRAAGSE